VQVPEFNILQVFMKEEFAGRTVPSGMVTSATKEPASQVEL
jgi:hypothetical protein